MAELKVVLVGGLALVIGGCSLAPTTPYQRPETGLASEWSATAIQSPTAVKSESALQSAMAVASASSAVSDSVPATVSATVFATVSAVVPVDRWWQRFDDARLTSLIDEVLSHNVDIKTAAERRRRAELELGLVEARSGPRVSGELQHQWGSSAARRYRSADATLSVSQEVDIWGIQAGTREAAGARVQAAAFARADSARRLIGLVGQAYWQVALMNARQKVAEGMLADARRGEALAAARHVQGATGAEPVSMAAAHIADVDADLAEIAARRQAARNALACLLGRPGDPPRLDDVQLPALARMPSIDAGVPADLLARRPDVQQKEWQLRADLAEVDVARANLYPRISLTGSLGSASNDLLSLLTRPISTLGSKIALPFLDWRARQLDIGVAETTHVLAKLAFQQTLHRALGEVEDALTQRRRYMTEEVARQAALTARIREEALAVNRYQAGATDLTPWLDKRQIRQRAEQALLQTRFEGAVNMMTLYLALGGDAA